jgi:hypothetical protein
VVVVTGIVAGGIAPLVATEPEELAPIEPDELVADFASRRAMDKDEAFIGFGMIRSLFSSLALRSSAFFANFSSAIFFDGRRFF